MGTVLFAILAFIFPIVLFVSAVLVHRHIVQQRLRKNSMNRVPGLDPPLGTRDPALLWPAPLSAKAGSQCSKSSHSSSSARLEEVVIIGRRPASAAAAAAASRPDSRSLDGSVVLYDSSSSSEGRASSEHWESPCSSSGCSSRVAGGMHGKSIVLDAQQAAELGAAGSSHHDSRNRCSNAEIATQQHVNSSLPLLLLLQQQQQTDGQPRRASAGAEGMEVRETLHAVEQGAAERTASRTVDAAAGQLTLGNSTPYYRFNSNTSSGTEATAQAPQHNSMLQRQEQQHRLSPAGASAADAADVLCAADQQPDTAAAAAGADAGAGAAAVSASHPYFKLGGSASFHSCSSTFDGSKGQSGRPEQLQRRLSVASADSDVRCDVLRTHDQHVVLTPVARDTTHAAAAACETPNNSLAGQYIHSCLQPVVAAKFVAQQPPALPPPPQLQQEQRQMCCRQ